MDVTIRDYAPTLADGMLVAYSATIYVDDERAANMAYYSEFRNHDYWDKTKHFARFVAFARGAWAKRQDDHWIHRCGRPLEDLLLDEFSSAHDHQLVAREMLEGKRGHVAVRIEHDIDENGPFPSPIPDAAYFTARVGTDLARLARGVGATRWWEIDPHRPIVANEVSGPSAFVEREADDASE